MFIAAVLSQSACSEVLCITSGRSGTARSSSALRGCGGRHRAEIGPAEQDGILGMFGRIGAHALDQQIRLVGRDARLRRREVEPVQGEGAVQHVHVGVDDARDDRLPMQIDDARAAATMLQDSNT